MQKSNWNNKTNYYPIYLMFPLMFDKYIVMLLKERYTLLVSLE